MELADKAVALAEKILSETDDWFILTNTKDSLASIYKMCGRYEEAKKVVHSMPELWPTQINDRMRSAAFILKGRDRLEGTSDLKPYLHQDLFVICDQEGQGYFEIGDYENALTIHHKFTELFSLLFVDGNPAGVKAMLNMMGMIENKLRLPLVPTRITTYEKMRIVLDSLNVKC
jgi:hypothetical protein